MDNNYTDPLKAFDNLIEALYTFIYTVLIAIVIIAVLFVIGFTLRKIYLLRDGKVDIAIGRYRAQGIIFGRLGHLKIFSNYAREGHVLALGGSGLGKTSALLIPTLESWKGTSFVVDISGDIESNAYMNDKLVYQPENLNTIPYNVFYSIDSLQNDMDKDEALEKLAFLLIPDLPPQESSANARFYNDEGRKILTAALVAFYYEGLDFVQICEKIMESSYQQLFRGIDNTGNELAIKYINAFAGTSEQNIAGCMQNASEAVKLFATNQYVANSIRRPKDGENCFTPTSIETHNVFFVIDDARLDVYAPLVHLVVAQVLEFFSKRSNDASHNILLCLDELASFGKLELIGALRKLRKKKIRIFCLTQSLADLQMIYGHDETKAMLTNFAFKVILGAADTETQEYFAKLIGHRKSKGRFINILSRKESYDAYIDKEYAVQPESLAMLRNMLILIYPGGYLKLRKNYYFKKGFFS